MHAAGGTKAKDRNGAPSATAAVAEGLLGAVSAVRRVARRQARRPWILTSLTGAQLELARLLRIEPGITVAQAAQQLQLAPNTISTLVGQMTDAGVVHRTSDTRDRRVAHLDLTSTAREQVETWRDRRTAITASAIDRLPDADRRAISDAVGALQRLSIEMAKGDGAP